MKGGSAAPSGVLQVIVAAAVIRFALSGFTPDFKNRMELSTPLSSFERLVEGSTLLSHGVHPYSGNLVHHSPILVYFHNAVAPYMNDLLWTLAYIVMDIIVALNLVSLVRPYRHLIRRVDHTNDDDALISTLVCAAYLLSPYTILSMLSQSSILFSNLAVSFALRGAMSGSIVMTAAGVSVAAYETMYPIILLPILAVVLQNHYQKSGLAVVAMTITGIGSLVGLSVALVGDLSFIPQTYGAVILVPELKPNVGLFWYFFLEVFDHYRAFFLVVFHMAFLSFAIPIVLNLRHRPLVGAFMLLGGIRIFKSYPAVGDNALYLALLPLFYHFVKESHHLYMYVITFLLCSSIAPVFLYLWLYPGSANANFPYAMGLVLTFSHWSILSDVLMLSKFEDYKCVFGSSGVEGHSLIFVRSNYSPRVDPPLPSNESNNRCDGEKDNGAGST